MGSDTVNRVIWIDLLKLFAMFLVLWGHCIQHLLASDPYSNYIYIGIYSFHMPLFMMLSGLFASKIIIRNLTQNFKDKFFQLIVPLILWGIIIWCVGLFLKQPLIKHFEDIFWGNTLWFLKSLFICVILFCLGTRNKKYFFIGLILTLLISQMINQYKVRYMYPCYVFGYMTSRYFDILKTKAHLLAIISAIIYCLMIPFWNINLMFPSLNFRYVFNQIIDRDIVNLIPYFGKVYFKLIIGLAGSWAVYWFFYLINVKISKIKGLNSIAENGKYTLSVYILQTLILETILANFINLQDANNKWLDVIVLPVVSLMIFIICIQIDSFFKKNKYLSLLMYPSKILRRKRR